MTDHLSPEIMSALVDGELAQSELEGAKAHIDGCLACASRAVNEWLLKESIGKAGQRYEMPVAFQNRMAGLIARGVPEAESRTTDAGQSWFRQPRKWRAFAGWAAAAAIILALGGTAVVEYRAHPLDTAASERGAMIREACDLHIAMLAASEPQVISSDRHTVKPWFQGKLPFSFNIPDALPADTTLDGANLAYLGSHPVAQLLFNIGRHRASVFVEEKNGGTTLGGLEASHSGFQVVGSNSDDLEMIAVSDVDRSRLEALANSLNAAQARH